MGRLFFLHCASQRYPWGARVCGQIMEIFFGPAELALEQTPCAPPSISAFEVLRHGSVCIQEHLQ